MTQFRIALTCLFTTLTFAGNTSAQANEPSEDEGPNFFGPEVQLNLNPDEVVDVDRPEDITPGAAPITLGKLEDIVPRPESHILDEARVFLPEQYDKLSAILKDPSHGLEFYVTAHTILPDETLENYALRVRDAWAQTDSCVILCYQRGSQLMTMCASDGIYQFLPKPEMASSFEKAHAAASEFEDAAGRLQIAVETFIGDVSGKINHIKANDRIFDRGILKILIALFSTLTLAGIVGTAFARMQKRSATQRATTYQFPLLDLPRRFGAPFGGGTIAEITFDSPASTKPQ